MVSTRHIRFALAATVLFVTLGIVAAVSFKGKAVPSPPKSDSRQIPQNIDVALNKAHLTEMRNGTIVWELVAERVEYDKSGEMAYLNDIRMEFAKTPSAGKIVVTAATGEYSNKNKNVRLKGSVRVQTENGALFLTEFLEYVASSSQFISSDLITFRHERLELTAKGMDMNVKQQVAHFKKMVEATVKGL